MIKIIKKGHERFNELCYKCGCEYEYTLDEIGKTLPGKTQCPCCGYYNEHKYFVNECSNLDVEDEYFINKCSNLHSDGINLHNDDMLSYIRKNSILS